MRASGVLRLALLLTAVLLLVILFAFAASIGQANGAVWLGSAALAALIVTLVLAELFFGPERRATRRLRRQNPTATVILVRNDDRSLETFLHSITHSEGVAPIGWAYTAVFNDDEFQIWAGGTAPSLVAAVPNSSIVHLGTVSQHLHHVPVLALEATVAVPDESAHLTLIPANYQLLGLFPFTGAAVILLAQEIDQRLQGAQRNR